MSQLETNTTDLQAILAQVNALPDAGSGGSTSGSGLEHKEVPAFTYTVNAVSGASYGFSQNLSGYWESKNKGVKSSYAICRVNFEVLEPCNITFDCINYAETKYDYGQLGLLDTALTLSVNPDSESSLQKNFYNLQSASVVNVVYENVPAGSHFIDVKFLKDSSTNKNNDSIQFKVQTAPTIEVLTEASLELIRAEDADLTPENIKSGVDIFGVTGTYTGGGTILETCTVDLFDGTQLYAIAYTTVDANGNVAAASVIPSGKAATITCLCGSVVAISHYRAGTGLISCTGSELLYSAEVQSEYGHSFIKLTCDAGETATFSTAASSND